MSPSLRLGLIGVGRWGRNYVREISKLSDVTLVAAASRNPNTPQIVGTACATYMDWHDMLEVADLDGVIVATPPPTHAAIVRDVILTGHPVLVEKPLTLNVEEAEELLSLATRRNSVVLVDHTHVFSPAFERLRQESRALGPIRQIESEAGNLGPFRPETPVLWDWGAHDIAMCVALLGGSPDRIEARVIDRQTVNGNSGEIIDIDMTYPDAIGARVRIGNVMRQKRRRMSVTFSNAKLVYDDISRSKLTLVPVDLPARELDVHPERPLSRVIRTFAYAIVEGCGFESLELGVKVTKVLRKCADSIASSESRI